MAEPGSTGWGRAVGVEVVRGRELPVFADRRGNLNELLADARRWGTRQYLAQGDETITYEQLNAVVGPVAAELAASGIGPGDRVMLLGRNSLRWVVAYFAALRAGAQVVSGNAWWSDAELTHAIAQVRPTLVLADEQRARSVPPAQRCESLGAISFAPAPGATMMIWPAASEDDIAQLVFTSGTTGMPKAAALTHRAVIGNQQNFLAITNRLPTTLPEDHPGTVNLVTVPLFHTGGLQQILVTLLTGGTLVFLRRGFDPAEVLDTIERRRVTVWGGVPTMLTRVMDHPDFASSDTSSVRTITVAGAYVTPDLMARVREAFPSARRSSGTIYGMTEAGGVLTAATGADLEARPGTVGRPVPTARVRIADPDDAGIGEIEADAPTVMVRYADDDAEQPFTDDGWLRTGDLGRFDEDGYLYIVGRSKDIVIRGGENIACSHVEEVLLTHVDVREAAVVPFPDADMGERVAAVVVVLPGCTLTVEELVTHTAQRLAYFEVPEVWWLRDEPLPTNATGKVVKRDLLTEWPTAAANK